MELPRHVPKPWGHELIWAQTEHYVGKILHVEAGQQLSLQYHREKDETIHVRSGRLLLLVDEGEGLRELRLGPGESYHLAPGVRHRLRAESDCDVLEASTPHLDDVVRLEDAYGREGTTEA